MKHKEELNSDIENSREESIKAEEIKEEGAIEGVNEGDPILKLEEELTASKDKYLRLYSEFENYKKRIQKDRLEQTRMAVADAFLSFIPVIDDFERALKSIDEARDVEPVKEGVKLIYTKLKNITVAKGLKPMESVGTPFDPELHDAIANVPVDKENQKGTVVEEIEKGYYLNDKVIRHAKVIVGK